MPGVAGANDPGHCCGESCLESVWGPKTGLGRTLVNSNVPDGIWLRGEYDAEVLAPAEWAPSGSNCGDTDAEEVSTGPDIPIKVSGEVGEGGPGGRLILAGLGTLSRSMHCSR